VAAVALACALAAGGCKPVTGSLADASADARASVAFVDAGSVEAGIATTTSSAVASGVAAAPDAGARDDTALPAATSDELTLRAHHLFEAITQDNPDLGVDLLFPRDAWTAARDATDPGKQWDAKVSSGFRHAVHALHKRTKGAERAQFVSFEIGRTVTEVTPRHKEWKTPLWQVHHARLTFLLDGRTLRWDVAELTSWKGAWYVSRLR
jgi:hypothetical protein